MSLKNQIQTFLFSLTLANIIACMIAYAIAVIYNPYDHVLFINLFYQGIGGTILYIVFALIEDLRKPIPKEEEKE